MTPIRIHPSNPKLFEFRGKPLVLLTATEHYGGVINREFDFEPYLHNSAENGITLTRLFMLFRELQSSQNPYSTCKPESTDYITPFERAGPGHALDGLPKYDLDRPNAEFYDRLHQFVTIASECGIIVEVTLFSNTYSPDVWSLNPLNASNNINDLEQIEWAEYNTARHPNIHARQLSHTQRIVEELNPYDNVIFEICNEPGGGNNSRPENPSPSEVDQWQVGIAQVIRQVEAGLLNKHLIAGQEAFTYHPWEQPSTKSFRDYPIDVVNMHPLPNTTYDGNAWHQGEFMSKQLCLRAVRDFCLATYHEPKPLNFDEDNVASRFRDPDGWTIHRKRAWTTLMSGGHYDVIDFSIYPHAETGTPASRRHIRIWMKHLSEFIHGLDLSVARPLGNELVETQPEHTLAATLSVPDEKWCIYLADERELDEPGCGDTIEGDLAVILPSGTYAVSCYSPVTGMESPALRINGGSDTKLRLPPFRHDIVILIHRTDA
jgi:hypothetical protein